MSATENTAIAAIATQNGPQFGEAPHGMGRKVTGTQIGGGHPAGLPFASIQSWDGMSEGVSADAGAALIRSTHPMMPMSIPTRISHRIVPYSWFFTDFFKRYCLVRKREV